MNFEAAIYRDSYHRSRWAVFSNASCTWYFPKRYGKQAAQKLARKMNGDVYGK